ncbi:uncharacterized protein E0L32_007809 [Thyridium curvatum]|uniref:Uncharacterized protein n=1 Tax=Thyridium curvatum TaxID=1093900 RepID=A0A507B3Y8_9PEZI|nr:uncharacterized protein E0L32_007809 [Thyridium curvatum]TPX11598.1 hypothetical protein E0L32_007809 [Thyridium curvatum]
MAPVLWWWKAPAARDELARARAPSLPSALLAYCHLSHELPGAHTPPNGGPRLAVAAPPGHILRILQLIIAKRHWNWHPPPSPVLLFHGDARLWLPLPLNSTALPPLHRLRPAGNWALLLIQKPNKHCEASHLLA